MAFLGSKCKYQDWSHLKSYNAKLIYLMQERCAALLYFYTVWVTQEHLLVLGASYLCNPLSYISSAKQVLVFLCR